MIEIKTNDSEKYIYIEISGHAGFDRAGRDIVCAAVSMLYQCFLQTVDDQGLVSCEFDDDVHAVRVIRCEETESASTEEMPEEPAAEPAEYEE